MARCKTVVSSILVFGIAVMIGFQVRERLALTHSIEEMRARIEQVSRLIARERSTPPIRSQPSVSKTSLDEVSLGHQREGSDSEFHAEDAGSVFRPIRVSPADLISAGGLSNLGLATPADCYRTWLWAINHRDVQVLAGTLYLDEMAQKRAFDFISQLPAQDAARYGSPAEFIAHLMLDELGNNYSPATAYQILDQAPTGPGTVTVSVATQLSDSTMANTDFDLVKTEAGWQKPIPAGLVGAYISSHFPQGPASGAR